MWLEKLRPVTSPVVLSKDVEKAILNAAVATKIIAIDRLKMRVNSCKEGRFYYLEINVETSPKYPKFEGVNYYDFLVIKNEKTPQKIEIYDVNIVSFHISDLDQYLNPEGIAYLKKRGGLLPALKK